MASAAAWTGREIFPFRLWVVVKGARLGWVKMVNT